MLPTREPPQNKRPTQTKNKVLEKNIPSKWIGKKSWCRSILILDKIGFKTTVIKRDTEGHFIILKGKIYQEDINIVNKYAPNIRGIYFPNI